LNSLATDIASVQKLDAGHAQFAKDVHKAGMTVNMNGDRIGTISSPTDELVMTFNPMTERYAMSSVHNMQDIKAVYNARPASLYLHPAKHLKTGQPYVVIAKNSIIKLYYIEGDKQFLVQGDNDSMVFSMLHSGNYQLEVQSDFYYKRIDIRL